MKYVVVAYRPSYEGEVVKGCAVGGGWGDDFLVAECADESGVAAKIMEFRHELATEEPGNDGPETQILVIEGTHVASFSGGRLGTWVEDARVQGVIDDMNRLLDEADKKERARLMDEAAKKKSEAERRWALSRKANEDAERNELARLKAKYEAKCPQAS